MAKILKKYQLLTISEGVLAPLGFPGRYRHKFIVAEENLCHVYKFGLQRIVINIQCHTQQLGVAESVRI